MNSKFLYLCTMIIFFSSLNVVGDLGSNEPEWFIKFKQECNSDKKNNDKWCAMFKHLPDKVKEELAKQLVRKKIRYSRYRSDSLYLYAIESARGGISQKHCLRWATAELIRHNQRQAFTDEHQEKSFKMMLDVLNQIVRGWFPGWHAERCVECCLEMID